MDNLRPHYLKVIADLKRQRSKIDATLQNLEQLVAVAHPQPAEADSSSSPPSPSHRRDRPPMIEAIKGVLRKVNQPLSPKFVARHLESEGYGDVSSKNIGSMLSRRSKEVGDIISLGYGKWGLKEWAAEAQSPLEGRDSANATPPSPAVGQPSRHHEPRRASSYVPGGGFPTS